MVNKMSTEKMQLGILRPDRTGPSSRHSTERPFRLSLGHFSAQIDFLLGTGPLFGPRQPTNKKNMFCMFEYVLQVCVRFFL